MVGLDGRGEIVKNAAGAPNANPSRNRRTLPKSAEAVATMNLRTRVQKIENRIDRLEGECVDHDITRIISFGPSRSDSLLDNAPAPPCSKCGKPGTILEITEEIVSVRDD
jgi:hypothetical protein